MNVSLIINTACMDPTAAEIEPPWRSGTYGERYDILQEIISLTVGDYDQVIVAGIFEPNAEFAYEYIPVPPVYADRRDALVQREIGARYSTGGILVFTHDDHMPPAMRHVKAAMRAFNYPNYPKDLIIVPQRLHGMTREVLNNGGPEFEDKPYMGGHSLAMSRDVWARVPWTTIIPHRCWDLPMTRIWQEQGVTIIWDDGMSCLDMEVKEDEE